MPTEFPGNTCEKTLAEAVPPKYLSKVAEQLANVFFELQDLTFDRIGRIWTLGDADLELITPAVPDGATCP